MACSRVNCAFYVHLHNIFRLVPRGGMTEVSWFDFRKKQDIQPSPDKPTFLFNGHGGSLGVKRSGRLANHSPPSSAEIKNAWTYTCWSARVFMAHKGTTILRFICYFNVYRGLKRKDDSTG
jgi:hypothetical protein